MKTKRFVRIFCFSLSVLLLFLTLPVATFAAYVPSITRINESAVMDDLAKFGIDYANYRKDEEATHGRLLYFLEFGYDYYGNTSDYGLFVYFWNPTGREVNTSAGKNYLEMYLTSYDGTTRTDTKKFPLELVNYSTVEGYEHVFYKFKVENVKQYFGKLARGFRSYNLVGIEIHHVGESNATDYKIAGRYTFTGYMPFHGEERTADTYLSVDVTDILTVDLELHPASWKTHSSDKGAGHQYELSSVYFSVPNDVIRDYGDPDDPTKGLREIDGYFSEQRINGIVSNDSAVYAAAYDAIGKHTDVYKNISLSFMGDYYVQSSQYQGAFGGFNYNNCYLGNTGHFDYTKINALSCALNFSERYFDGIESERLLQELQKIWTEKPNYFLAVEDGRQQGFQSYHITTEDSDLASKIRTYASSHNPFISWLQGEFACYDANESYSGMDPISVVDFDVSDILYTTEYIADKYFVQESEVPDLKSFMTSSAAKDKTTYLLRFAVTDYYFDNCYVNLNGLKVDGLHYYFEKTVFKDFDIVSLTYENQYSQRVKIPVVCSPIDIVGSITATPGTDTGSAVDKAKDFFDDVANYNFFVVLLALLLFVAVILVFLPLLKPIFSAIGSLFSFIFGNSSGSRQGKDDARYEASYRRERIRQRALDIKRAEKRSSKSRMSSENKGKKEVAESSKKSRYRSGVVREVNRGKHIWFEHDSPKKRKKYVHKKLQGKRFGFPSFDHDEYVRKEREAEEKLQKLLMSDSKEGRRARLQADREYGLAHGLSFHAKRKKEKKRYKIKK